MQIATEAYHIFAEQIIMTLLIQNYIYNTYTIIYILTAMSGKVVARWLFTSTL